MDLKAPLSSPAPGEKDDATPAVALKRIVSPMRHNHQAAGWMLQPETCEQVSLLLERAHTQRQTLALTRPDALALAEPIWLNLSGLQQIRHYRRADLTIKVETGISMQALQAALGESGHAFSLSYPKDVRLMDVLAEDRPGLETGFAGYPRDYVLALEVVNAQGTLTRCGADVMKNVSGYDLVKLYTGSRHTLGAIVVATLKVEAKPGATLDYVLKFSSWDTAMATAQAFIDSRLPLYRCELFELPAGIAQDGWGMLVGMRGEAAYLKPLNLEIEALAPPGSITALAQEEAQHLGEQLACWPRQALVVSVSVTPNQLPAVESQLQAVFAAPVRPMGQYRPKAGLGFFCWEQGCGESLPELLAQFQHQIQRLDGQLFVLQTPPGFTDLYAQYNLPGEPIARRVMHDLKQVFDPHQVLYSQTFPLQGEATA